MWPRNKMNHRRRKKMSPRKFLSANLVTQKKKKKKKKSIMKHIITQTSIFFTFLPISPIPTFDLPVLRLALFFFFWVSNKIGT